MPRAVFVCISLLLLPLAAVSGPAVSQEPEARRQEPTPQFRTAVEVLRIQVGVHDEDGDFVSGLGEADFELLVDGEPRAIIDVLEMSAGRVVRSATSVPEDAAVVAGETQTLPPGARRQFLVFLDLMAADFAGLRNARSAAVDFVEDVVQPEDRLGLAMYSARSGLEMMVPFTADHEQVRQRLKDLSIGVSMRAVDPALAGIPVDEIAGSVGGDVADIVAEVEASRFALGAEQVIVALRQLGRELSVIQGRKDVLYFSSGISDDVVSSTGFAHAMQSATASLRASDTVLHTLQPDVMRGTGVHDVRNMQSSLQLNDISGSIGRNIVDRAFLYYLSGETGGESYWFRHQLRRGLADVEEATRRYYVIAFQIGAGDPRVASLQLRTSRQGAVVRVPERLALTRTFGELTAVQQQLRVAEALELGAARDDLALMVTGVPLAPEGPSRPLALALQVPASQLAVLAGERGDDAVALEVLGLAIDVDGGIHDVFRGRVTAQVRGLDGSPFRYVHVVRVPPGAYHLKVLVREAGTDSMSVRSLRFESPLEVRGGLRLSGPLPVAPASAAPFVWDPEAGSLAGARDADGARDGAPPEPYPFRIGQADVAPDLDDRVLRGESRDFYVAIDGLVPHPVTRIADWRLRVEAVGDGSRVREIVDAEVALLDDADPTAPRLLLRVPFPSFLAFGHNELRVRVTDRITGASAEGAWPFRLLPG